jgi:hypothetical protein
MTDEERQHIEGETEGSTSILALPEATLIKIVCLLSQRDKISVSLVCKKWLEMTLSSNAVWNTVCLEIQNWTCAVSMSQAFLPWLYRRAKHVKGLKLINRISVESVQSANEANELWNSSLTAAVMSTSSLLQTLTISTNRDFFVGGWMASLTALTSASFTAKKLTLLQGMERLIHLQRLVISSSTDELVVQSKNIFPSSLLHLTFDRCYVPGELPAGLESATSLTYIKLHCYAQSNYRWLNCSRLSCLVHLKELDWGFTDLPDVVSYRLSELRILHTRNMSSTSTTALSFTRLEALKNIGIISMAGTRFTEFPPSLSQKTSLRALYVEGNPQLKEITAGPYIKYLKVLSIDWHILFTSHYNVLNNAFELEQLHILADGKQENLQKTESSPDAVCFTLLRLPHLKEIAFRVMLSETKCVVKSELMYLAFQLSAVKRFKVSISQQSPIIKSIDWLNNLECPEGHDECFVPM